MKTQRQFGRFLFALGLTGALCNSAHASQFPITTNNTAKLTFGAAFDGTNYLVPIQGDGLFSRANTNRQVGAQRVSQSGTLVGTLIDTGQNASLSTSNTPIPHVAFDGANYLVAWTDRGNSPNEDIYGQLISTTGVLVGSPFPISQASGAQWVHGIVFDGTNHFVIWEDFRRGGGGSDVYGQRVSRSGLLVGGEIQISPADISRQYGNNVIATHENHQLPTGATNYFVVWTEGQSFGPESKAVVGQFVSPNGTLVGSPIIIKPDDGVQIPVPNLSGIGFDGTNYLVSWHKDVSPTEHDLVGQRVSRAGSLVGGVVTISTAPAIASLPFLVFDGVNYLVTWSDSFNTTNQTCKARFIDATGSPVSSEFAPFAAQGTNAPLVAGPTFDGKKFFTVGMLGTFSAADIYGTFIPKSTAPPRLDVAGPLASTQFPLRLTGTPGITYAIQTVTNLALTNWTMLVTNSATNGTFSFTDTHATNASRFYRAVKQ